MCTASVSIEWWTWDLDLRSHTARNRHICQVIMSSRRAGMFASLTHCCFHTATQYVLNKYVLNEWFNHFVVIRNCYLFVKGEIPEGQYSLFIWGAIPCPYIRYSISTTAKALLFLSDVRGPEKAPDVAGGWKPGFCFHIFQLLLCDLGKAFGFSPAKWQS